MKIIKSAVYSLILTTLFVLPVLAVAQNDPAQADPAAQKAGANHILDRLNNVASGGGYQTDGSATLPVIIGTVIGTMLGFLGVVFLGLMVLAGYNWMTAQGNEEQVEKAKKNIRQAVIGLIVVLSAWSIWTFILQRFILLG